MFEYEYNKPNADRVPWLIVLVAIATAAFDAWSILGVS